MKKLLMLITLLVATQANALRLESDFDVSLSCKGYYNYKAVGIYSYDTVLEGVKGRYTETTVILEDGAVFVFRPETGDGLLEVGNHAIWMNSCSIRIGE